MSCATRVLAAAALLASACATAPAVMAPPTQTLGGEQAAPDASKKKPRMICKMERSTGSNIAQEVCRPEQDDSANIQRLQDQLKNWRGQWLRGG